MVEVAEPRLHGEMQKRLINWSIREDVGRQLRQQPRGTQERLLIFLKDLVERVNDPRLLATNLFGDFSGLWRFRVGDHRLICRLKGKRVVVLVLSFANCLSAYQ
jgi:mRNA interferase RelE/StbE